MRILITKPVKGLVTVRLDGSRDVTRTRKVLKDVPYKQVALVLGPELAAWEARKQVIKDALRGE